MSSLKDFEQLNKLGEGAFSQVFKVKRKSDGQIYALKRVKLGSLSVKEKENAVNEVRILASINDPNIVGYKEAFLDDLGNMYIVMEFAGGGDLYHKIEEHKKKRTTIPEPFIWRYLIQLLLGLKTLHGMKIFHRDLKTANIFLTADLKHCKLGDLNVSKVAKSNLAYTQTGTPYYASPEVWRDQPYDQKCDIWSLGCVLYEACALKPPFRADSMKGLFNRIQSGKCDRIPSPYSEELSEIVKKCLQLIPKNRPNAEELLNFPSVLKRLQEVENIDLVENTTSDGSLMGTIKVPRNIKDLNKVLPKANYDQVEPKNERPKGDEKPTIDRTHSASVNRPNLIAPSPLNKNGEPTNDSKGNIQLKPKRSEAALPPIRESYDANPRSGSRADSASRANVAGREIAGGNPRQHAPERNLRIVSDHRGTREVPIDSNNTPSSTPNKKVYQGVNRPSSNISENRYIPGGTPPKGPSGMGPQYQYKVPSPQKHPLSGHQRPVLHPSSSNSRNQAAQPNGYGGGNKMIVVDPFKRQVSRNELRKEDVKDSLDGLVGGNQKQQIASRPPHPIVSGSHDYASNQNLHRERHNHGEMNNIYGRPPIGGEHNIYGYHRNNNEGNYADQNRAGPVESRIPRVYSANARNILGLNNPVPKNASPGIGGVRGSYEHRNGIARQPSAEKNGIFSKQNNQGAYLRKY